jgi:hypothetical protein
MARYRVQGPDGAIHVFEGPDNAKPADIEAFAAQTFGKQQTPAAVAPAPEQSTTFGQDIGNLIGGAVRGAGSVGATLLAPIDMAARAMNKGQPINIGGYDIAGQDRRAGMTGGLQEMGVDPESTMYGIGKFGGEMAGTAGAGGMLARGLSAVPTVASRVPGLIEALRSGGMTGPNIGTRAVGGAVSGGASAVLVNPEDVGSGAAIGAALPVVGKVGSGITKILGGTTGVGEEALKQAYQAGKQGGTKATSFVEAMREGQSMNNVLDAARANLSAMNAQKQNAYRSGMVDIRKDKSILDFANIDDAVGKAFNMATFKGQVKNQDAVNALSKIRDSIDEWKSLDATEFHTPEGLDALKQRVGGLLESIPFEQKTARTAAGNVYNSIKNEINTQAPTYAKVMKDYHSASETMQEIERALSLGQRASDDTAMRKLQSLMRNNVNTNYGYRDQLARQLEQAGGNEFMPALAGQALNDYMPRGIQRAVNPAGAIGIGALGNIPAAVGMGLVSSPRLVGEAMYKAGQGARLVDQRVDPRLIQMLRQGTYRGAPLSFTDVEQQ